MEKSQPLVIVDIDYWEAKKKCCPSTHIKCAERRLLDACIMEAEKRCIPPYKIKSWIHRKMGGVVSVFRFRADGTVGCCVPCYACRKELLKYDLVVHCLDPDGRLFCGKLDDEDAPPSQFTSGQRRNLRMIENNRERKKNSGRCGKTAAKGYI